MACNLTAGITKGCRDNAGGIVEAYIGNFENMTFTEGSDGLITAITTGSAAATDGYYTFVPNKNSSTWGETIQGSLENGTIGYEQAATLVFQKNEAALRNQVKLLGQANLSIIVKDKNEKYWLIGKQNGAELLSGGSSAGTNLTDLNGWTLNFSATEPQPGFEVSGSIITDIQVTV